MTSIDIHFPMAEYKQYTSLKNFCIIFPLESALSSNINLKTMVQIVGWPDSLFFERLHAGQSMPGNKEGAKSACYYDIAYLRECNLRYVTPYEWNFNWGPTSVSEWLDFTSADLPDAYVKVVQLVKPNKDLKVFNRGSFINAGEI